MQQNLTESQWGCFKMEDAGVYLLQFVTIPALCKRSGQYSAYLGALVEVCAIFIFLLFGF